MPDDVLLRETPTPTSAVDAVSSMSRPLQIRPQQPTKATPVRSALPSCRPEPQPTSSPRSFIENRQAESSGSFRPSGKATAEASDSFQPNHDSPARSTPTTSPFC